MNAAKRKRDRDGFALEATRRLLEGSNWERLQVSDVSDHQLYGRKHRTLLDRAEAEKARSLGLEPVVWQAVLWWCFVYMPVIPEKTVAVMPCQYNEEDADSDERYRIIEVAFDRRQAGRQAVASWGSLLLAIAVVVVALNQ